MTLFILDIKEVKKEIKKFVILAICVAAFGGIYEIFSHQVYSVFMLGAFLVPLVLGDLVYYLFFVKCGFGLNNAANNLYKSFIYTTTIASIMKGVLDIYGTTNSFILVYPFASAILLLLTIAFNIKK